MNNNIPEVVLLEKFQKAIADGLPILDEYIAILPAQEAFGLGNFPSRLRAMCLLEVKKLKEKVEEVILGLNKAYESIQKGLGQQLIDTEEYEIRMDGYLITANADGIFTIENPRKFYDWCIENRKEEIKDVFDFLEQSQSKRWLKKVCTERLEAGLNLPSGIRPFLRTCVRIRSASTAKYKEIEV